MSTSLQDFANHVVDLHGMAPICREPSELDRSWPAVHAYHRRLHALIPYDHTHPAEDVSALLEELL